MKQLLILSGKGGTGKTTIASAFIELANAGAFADCDVDAPNLHMVTRLSPNPRRTDHYGLPRAEIDPALCSGCGVCFNLCSFGAILKKEDRYEVDGYSCEGCGLCGAVCQAGAIKFNEAITGELMLYRGESAFSTAKLRTGSGASGKLVSAVKNQLKSAAEGAEFAIIDGSPGIGCPVIASLNGVDLLLLVAEPSLSGISDMERIIQTAGKGRVKTLVCVNKYDINLEKTEEIIGICKKEGLQFAGRIPFDAEAVRAVNMGGSIAGLNSPVGEAVRDVFDLVMKTLLLG